MSRAFVNEDAAGEPPPRYVLPKRDDPGYDEAAAWALMEGANRGDSRSAEIATGYRWGERKLVRHVRKIRDRAHQQRDDRLAQLADRYIKQAETKRPAR